MISNTLLNDVTLVCADCVNLDRAIRAMDVCLSLVNFKNVKLLSHVDSDYKHIVKIDKISSIQEYSEFCIRKMYEYVTTPYALICQWDGYIVNPNKWDDEWLNWDYIGCHSNSWSEIGEDGKGGNGGFSLRSLKLMKEGSKFIKESHPEDTAYSASKVYINGNRELLEENGFKIAPNKVQKLFGFEVKEINVNNETPFGIHGCGIEYHPLVRKELYASKQISKIFYGLFDGRMVKEVPVDEFNNIMKVTKNKNMNAVFDLVVGDPVFGSRKKLYIMYNDGVVQTVDEGDIVL